MLVDWLILHSPVKIYLKKKKKQRQELNPLVSNVDIAFYLHKIIFGRMQQKVNRSGALQNLWFIKIMAF